MPTKVDQKELVNQYHNSLIFVENIVEKPDRIRDDIVNLCDLPRIELFARQKQKHGKE